MVLNVKQRKLKVIDQQNKGMHRMLSEKRRGELRICKDTFIYDIIKGFGVDIFAIMIQSFKNLNIWTLIQNDSNCCRD